MNFFRLTGYARRRELLAVAVVFGLLAAVLWWLQSGPHWQSARYTIAAMSIGLAALLATMVRRLHDIGRSGAWALLTLVPVVGFVLLLALLVLPSAGRKRIGIGRASNFGRLVLVLLVIFGVGRIFWAPYWIPSESMKPALLVGDYLLVRHIDADDVRRGDVVVFRSGVTGQDHVGRIIGLPGDRVQMRSGLVWLNGQLLPQIANGQFEERMGPQGPKRIRPRCKAGAVGDGGICSKSRLTETIPAMDGMPAREFDVLNITNGAFGDDTGIFVLPPGQFFVLGDNRDNSIDSRYSAAGGGIGFIDGDGIIGRAGLVLFSARGDQLWKFWTWRRDRFLKGVE